MNFKINNRGWEIIELSQREIKDIQNKRRANEDENINSVDTRYHGITYVDVQKIYLDKDLPEDKKKATLIHELVHCYISNYITHSDKQYCEEDVADIVANSFEIITEIVNNYIKEEVIRQENRGIEMKIVADEIALRGETIC